MVLSPQQIAHFSITRFMKFPGIIPPELVSAAKQQLLADFADPTPPFRPAPDAKIYGLLERDGAYGKIIRYAGILDILADLIGDDIVFTTNRHNHGSLNRRGENRVRLHRDVLRIGHYTVIVYLDDAPADNAATIVVPGSHLWQHFPEDDGGMWLDPEGHPYSDLSGQTFPVIAGAGDILVFDSYVYHSVGENRTDNTRATLALGYAPVDELIGVVPPNQVLVRGRDLYRGNIAGTKP